MLLHRGVDESRPDRGLVVEIEVLMLDAARLHRQQDKIAFFPVPALTIDDGIAFSFHDEDQEPALMHMPPRLGGDRMDEDPPLLQRRLLERDRVHVEFQLALPRLEHVAVFRADHHRALEVALLQLGALAQHRLVRIVLDRRAFPLFRPFHFSHYYFPSALFALSASSAARTSAIVGAATCVKPVRFIALRFDSSQSWRNRAPEKPSVSGATCLTISSISLPPSTLGVRRPSRRISARAAVSGRPTAICTPKRPGRRTEGSIRSMRLVAPSTITRESCSTPSSSAKSWLTARSVV